MQLPITKLYQTLISKSKLTQNLLCSSTHTLPLFCHNPLPLPLAASTQITSEPTPTLALNAPPLLFLTALFPDHYSHSYLLLPMSLISLVSILFPHCFYCQFLFCPTYSSLIASTHSCSLPGFPHSFPLPPCHPSLPHSYLRWSLRLNGRSSRSHSSASMKRSS